jgi:thymidylate synthase (FAD)
MDKGHVIKVLDHGYVKFIDSMGSDETVIEAARMSTSGGFVSWEPYDGHPRGDSGLLEYLYKHRHMTPFEMGELCIEVQAPIFVFREWHRHRTQSYNELSARYTQMPNLHYLPDPTRLIPVQTTNKQAGGTTTRVPTMDEAADAVVVLRADQEATYDLYEAHLEMGVPKEVARLNTPVARYSKMRAKTDVRNWLAFLDLRMRYGAQWEIQQFAGAVAEIVKAVWPRTYELFLEHTLYAVTLSRNEVEFLKAYLDGSAGPLDKLPSIRAKLDSGRR